MLHSLWECDGFSLEGSLSIKPNGKLLRLRSHSVYSVQGNIET